MSDPAANFCCAFQGFERHSALDGTAYIKLPSGSNREAQLRSLRRVPTAVLVFRVSSGEFKSESAKVSAMSDGLVHSPKNCAASWLAEPHHPQHNHTIYNQKRFRRVTEFDVFLLLGDSATTSNVAVGLVRCMRRASDELDRCETMQTSR